MRSRSPCCLTWSLPTISLIVSNSSFTAWPVSSLNSINDDNKDVCCRRIIRCASPIPAWISWLVVRLIASVTTFATSAAVIIDPGITRIVSWLRIVIPATPVTPETPALLSRPTKWSVMLTPANPSAVMAVPRAVAISAGVSNVVIFTGTFAPVTPPARLNSNVVTVSVGAPGTVKVSVSPSAISAPLAWISISKPTPGTLLASIPNVPEVAVTVSRVEWIWTRLPSITWAFNPNSAPLASTASTNFCASDIIKSEFW